MNFRYGFDFGLVTYLWSVTDPAKYFSALGFAKGRTVKVQGGFLDLVLESSQSMNKFYFLTYMGQKYNAQNANLPSSLWPCGIKTNTHNITILNSISVWKLWPLEQQFTVK